MHRFQIVASHGFDSRDQPAAASKHGVGQGGDAAVGEGVGREPAKRKRHFELRRARIMVAGDGERRGR